MGKKKPQKDLVVGSDLDDSDAEKEFQKFFGMNDDEGGKKKKGKKGKKKAAAKEPEPEPASDLDEEDARPKPKPKPKPKKKKPQVIERSVYDDTDEEEVVEVKGGKGKGKNAKKSGDKDSGESGSEVDSDADLLAQAMANAKTLMASIYKKQEQEGMQRQLSGTGVYCTGCHEYLEQSRFHPSQRPANRPASNKFMYSWCNECIDFHDPLMYPASSMGLKDFYPNSDEELDLYISTFISELEYEADAELYELGKKQRPEDRRGSPPTYFDMITKLWKEDTAKQIKSTCFLLMKKEYSETYPDRCGCYDDQGIARKWVASTFISKSDYSQFIKYDAFPNILHRLVFMQLLKRADNGDCFAVIQIYLMMKDHVYIATQGQLDNNDLKKQLMCQFDLNRFWQKGYSSAPVLEGEEAQREEEEKKKQESVHIDPASTEE